MIFLDILFGDFWPQDFFIIRKYQTLRGLTQIYTEMCSWAINLTKANQPKDT